MAKPRYKTDPKAKERLCDLIKWYNSKNGILNSNVEESIELYLKDSDIAIQNIHIIHGANTRNPKNEVIMALCAMGLGFIIATILIRYGVLESLVNWISSV